MALRLKPDAKLRRMFYHPDSFSHPAKLHIGLFQEIVARYCPEPCTILDPMAGSGTVLLATQLGHTVIANEMELHFIVPMLASWQKIQDYGPQLGYQMGQAVIVRGDARMLPLQSADAIVTSPPWEQSLALSDDWPAKHAAELAENYAKNHPGATPKGNKAPYRQGTATSYTRPVDAVVTSPPYEHSISRNTDDTTNRYEYNPEWAEREGRSQKQLSDSFLAGTYSTNGSTNIGNLRGQKYWESMRQVYAECHRVLIPRGVMALVVKGYTRDKKYVDLPGQTASLIETLGFTVFDRWEREVPLSFWRTLQKQSGNWDEALRYEHVIVARKIGEGTRGVDAIVTSPPYEGSISAEDDGIDWSKAGPATGNRRRGPGSKHYETLKAQLNYTRPEEKKL